MTSIVLLLIFFSFTSQALVGAYNNQCLNITQQALEGNASLEFDRTIIAFGSELNRPVLTIHGCELLCGSRQNFYSDVGSRLLSWPIPILLLMTCMLLAPIAGSRFVTILHLLGDPGDSIWSLIANLENRSKVYQMVSQNIWLEWDVGSREQRIKYLTIILENIVDLTPGRNFVLPENLPMCCCRDQALGDLYRKTAGELVGNMFHDLTRTCFAILVYFIGVFVNFIPEIGGSLSPSGGMLASALMLAWLPTLLLVSNVAGQRNSFHNRIGIILRFEKELSELQDRHLQPCPIRIGEQYWIEHIRRQDWNDYLDSQAWSGGITSLRLDKYDTWTRQTWWKQFQLLLASTIPLMFAFTGSFLVLYSAPTWLSCRHLMIIAMVCAWLLSLLLTYVIARCLPLHDDKVRYKYILIKDAFVAFPIVVLLIASTSGLFNSCWCRSSVYTPSKPPVVQLRPAHIFEHNNKIVYPSIVAICLSLEMGVFFWILRTERIGLRVMKWTEKEKRAAMLGRSSPRRSSDIEFEVG